VRDRTVALSGPVVNARDADPGEPGPAGTPDGVSAAGEAGEAGESGGTEPVPTEDQGRYASRGAFAQQVGYVDPTGYPGGAPGYPGEPIEGQPIEGQCFPAAANQPEQEESMTGDAGQVNGGGRWPVQNDTGGRHWAPDGAPATADPEPQRPANASPTSPGARYGRTNEVGPGYVGQRAGAHAAAVQGRSVTPTRPGQPALPAYPSAEE
jgi:hypothetical protein